MSTPVIMPKFGMAQEEGTIIRWVKQAGDAVEKGDTLLEVQTDKIDMEVEAPATGVLGDIRFGPDATVPVATVIATIYAPSEATAASSTVSAAGSPAGKDASPLAPRPSPLPPRPSPVAQRMAAAEGLELGQVAGTGPQGRITKADVAEAMSRATAVGEVVPAGAALRATPAARRIARQQALPLAVIAGTGPKGRIQAVDVLDFAQQATAQSDPGADQPVLPGAPAGPDPGTPLRGMRRTIAARLGQAWQSIPHIFLSASIDLAQAEALRGRLEADVAQQGGRLTPTVLIAKAVALALTRHPRLNAWLRSEGDQLMLAEQTAVALGIAVALDDGLIVPVVHGAEQLGLAALAARIAGLSSRARAGTLLPDEVSGGTFTISNLGMYPIDHFTAIINPPQVAILAVGRAQIQPVWDGQSFQPRPVLEVTLSADHRAVDGAVAAAFLAEVKSLLEEPLRMLL
jgi:pyruvate dehydrogenase E2 component (dihydrolipoamide acetyltransferase)